MKKTTYWRRGAAVLLTVLLLLQLLPGLTAAAEGGADKVVNNVDWPSFMSRNDLFWDTMPGQWYDAPFMGNGTLGTWMRQTGNRLEFEVSRGDVYDHRDDTAGLLHHKCRLPNGRFVVNYAGTAAGGSLRLNLYDAELSGTVNTSKGSLQIRSLVHTAQDLIVLEITPTGGEDAFTVDFVADAAKTSRANPPADYQAYPAQVRSADGGVTVSTQEMPESAAYHTLGRGAGQYATAWQMVDGADGKKLIYISEAFSYPGTDARQQAIDTVKAAVSTGADALTASHRDWWHDYYQKSFLSIPYSKAESFYWIQMYKMASASREDGGIMDLMGPWYVPGTGWPAVWTNLNIQLQYLPYFPANHAEEGAALLNNLYRYRDNLRINAEAWAAAAGRTIQPVDYDADPYLVTRSTDKTLSSIGDGMETFKEFGDLAYILNTCWQQYRYTMDDDMLRTKLYPLMKGAFRLLENLTYKDAGGKIHMEATYSPELGPETGIVDCHYTLSLYKFLASSILYTVDRFGLTDNIEAHARDVVDNLTPYPTNANGFMLGTGNAFGNIGHRHWSHLFAVYPLYEATYEDPAWNALVTQSVDHWLKWGVDTPGTNMSGYSFAAAVSFAAMKNDGDAALRYLDAFMDIQRLHRATMYEEGAPVIESPLYLARSMQEMVLLSYNGVIRPFAGAPAAWKDIAFADMLADGGFTVSAKRENGVTRFVQITSNAGERCVVNPAMTGTVKAAGSRSFTLTPLPDGFVEIDLKKGETVTLYTGDALPPLTVNAVAPMDNTNAWGIHEDVPMTFYLDRDASAFRADGRVIRYIEAGDVTFTGDFVNRTVRDLDVKMTVEVWKGETRVSAVDTERSVASLSTLYGLTQTVTIPAADTAQYAVHVIAYYKEGGGWVEQDRMVLRKPVAGLPQATGLTAVNGDNLQIDLSWSVPALTGEGYALYRRDPVYAEERLVAVLAAHETSYTDLVQGGRVYTYRLYALDEYGTPGAGYAEAVCTSPPGDWPVLGGYSAASGSEGGVTVVNAASLETVTHNGLTALRIPAGNGGDIRLRIPASMQPALTDGVMLTVLASDNGNLPQSNNIVRLYNNAGADLGRFYRYWRDAWVSYQIPLKAVSFGGDYEVRIAKNVSTDNDLYIAYIGVAPIPASDTAVVGTTADGEMALRSFTRQQAMNDVLGQVQYVAGRYAIVTDPDGNANITYFMNPNFLTSKNVAQNANTGAWDASYCSTRSIAVRLTYLDKGTGQVRLRYYKEDAGNPGARESGLTALSFNRTNTGEWKTYTFLIDDFFNDNTQSNNQFCLQVLGGDIAFSRMEVVPDGAALTRTLASVMLTRKPDKGVYTVGDTLDTAGMTLLARYSDGSAATVTEGFTTAYSFAQPGTATVTVSFGGKSTQFSLPVTPLNQSPEYAALTALVTDVIPRGDYPEDLYGLYLLAVEQGRLVLAKADGTVAELRTAIADIELAMALMKNPLPPVADKTLLRAAVAAGQELDVAPYTESSVDALWRALDEADIVAGEDAATQAEVDGALAALLAAMAAPKDKNLAAPGLWLRGDVDRSGGIDSTDARLVLQYEVGLVELNAPQTEAADVSGDTPMQVDSTDARMILQYEVGLLRW